MTAIKKFSRLEAKAVWKENDNKPPRSVIVSFGKSSIIISTENAFPLDHWSFNTIVMISKSKKNTIFSQGSNQNYCIDHLNIFNDKFFILIGALAKNCIFFAF